MTAYTSKLWAFFGLEAEQTTPPGADALRKAYRAEALKSHPDKNPHDPEGAKSRFQFVKKAYDELMELLSTGAIKNAPVEEPTPRQPEDRSEGSHLQCNGSCCQGDVLLKGRAAKESEKKQRQAENAKAQADARRKKWAKIKEKNREIRALQALRDEFDAAGKTPRGKKRGGESASAGQKLTGQELGPNIEEINKALALSLKQQSLTNNLRSRANCPHSDATVDAEAVKPDVEANFAAEKRDLDFWSSAALNEFANPNLLFEGDDLLARQNQKFQSDKEREERNGQAVEDKLNNLLAAKEVSDKKNSQSKPRPRKPQTYAEILKNGKPDTDFDASKQAAIAWTTQHLEDLRQENITASTSLVPYHAGQLQKHGEEILPNMNLTLSHYIDPQERRGNWKQGIQQYAYVDVDQEELELTRGAGFERGGKHFAYANAYFED